MASPFPGMEPYLEVPDVFPGQPTGHRQIACRFPENFGYEAITVRPLPRRRQVALSAEAKQGLGLFEGDAGCVRCHQGPLLSDNKLYRLGVSSKDGGLAALTGKKEDTGKFRTPSLRNIAETGPYMHKGSKKTLYEVVEFYDRGVPTTTSDGLPLDVAPLLGQSFSEIPALVAFLEALTGEAPKVEPPQLP